MTKKDYELIAGGIRQGLLASEGHNIKTETVTRTARFLAIELKLDNPRFNRTKFLQACGIETKVLGINWKDGTSTIHTDKGVKTVPTSQVQQ